MPKWLVPAALLAVLAYGFATEVVIPLRTPMTHCSCPIKGPCCEGPVCPMENARRESHERSLRSCDHSDLAPAMARPQGVFFDAPTVAESPSQSRAFVAIGTTTLRGVSRAPELPPRV